ncbi:sigma-54 dependent transcriptional regulator [Acidipila sp. EB88]|uniref:sigma-54-dependent transcriptional regulator n=1 Tax=Acidipila sp. EB88 TaxID=2305226 RepID=UPI000F5EFBC9|nr:sigma-54 dependent transcriptional regulator [Acidipila sp. EB88]RRA48761.1 sigma-54-dependent Fis family transcriptional regulator [Acidipila sp. EB88]
MTHILIADDETTIRTSLSEILEEEGYAVASTGTVAEAMVLLRDAHYDVLLLDVWMPDRDGLDALDEISTFPSEGKPEVIMISGHGTIETAVRATKLGAFDFLEKPLSIERTLITIKNAVDKRQLRADNRELKQQLAGGTSVSGNSISAKALRQQIRLMAPTNGRVLIYGESGVGKELIARAMHAESLRSERIFLELKCAAIPEDFIESELFGHRNGAVAGAPPEKRGTFERADGGTLLLDEVGDMSLKTQAKVLRALDEQSFTPLGGREPLHVDVRVIATTNKNLEEEIAHGNFREDLFYRLNVIPFFVPPLRERREDIPPLVSGFLQELGREYGRPHVEIAGDALEVMKGYNWPGNVRELKNIVERMLILNPQAQRIERKHLPALMLRTPARPAGATEEFASLQQAREAYERDFILKKIDECLGNMSRAAEALGLERSHLYRKMRALGIPVREV